MVYPLIYNGLTIKLKNIQYLSTMQEVINITLNNLPKHSLNKIYSGVHWSQRKKDKDTYAYIIKNQFKHVFRKDQNYKVGYTFKFKNKPLDLSNTVYMLKMIEDVLFEDDTYKIVRELNIKSIKSDKDSVDILVTILKD